MKTPLRPIRLPMYDWPEVREATRALETALQAGVMDELGLGVQDFEAQPEDPGLFEAWEDPKLLLTQTCGYPLVTFLSGKVSPVLTPHYVAPGCEGPLYRSHILVRADSSLKRLEDLEGTRAAFNSTDSQSGYNAFRHVIAPLAQGEAFFSELVETGGHLKSMVSVAEGGADVCCTDAVCLELARRYRPELFSLLRPIAVSRAVPGLPFIAAAGHDEAVVEGLRRAVTRVFSDPKTQKSRERLCIRGFSVLTGSDYAPLTEMRLEAEALRYPALK